MLLPAVLASLQRGSKVHRPRTWSIARVQLSCLAIKRGQNQHRPRLDAACFAGSVLSAVRRCSYRLLTGCNKLLIVCNKCGTVAPAPFCHTFPSHDPE